MENIHEKGFSLVELMVALIIISVIAGALCPVVTKKLKSRAISIQAQKEKNIDCKTFDENCTKCTKDGCSECKLGYDLTAGKCDTFCKGDTMMIVNDLCVTKCNVGDCGLALSYSEGKCWKKAGACNDIYPEYSGCNRTLCDYKAAVQACSNLSIGGRYGWRLPTMYESRHWQAYSVGLGKNGLMLCDDTNTGISNYCGDTEECVGSWHDRCVPYVFWLGGEYSSERRMVRGLMDSFLTFGNEYDYYAFSVRCVRELY